MCTGGNLASDDTYMTRGAVTARHLPPVPACSPMDIRPSKNHPPRVVLAINGVIGAGKSTALDKLPVYLPADARTATEPCEEWQNFPLDDGSGRTENMLQQLADDPAGNAYLFQNMTLMTRVCGQQKNICGPVPASVGVLERDPIGDWLFAACILRGTRWAVYRRWWKDIVARLAVSVDVQVYLRVSVDTAMRRIEKRSRGAESKITRAYIEQLVAAHDDLYLGTGPESVALRAQLGVGTVVELDGNVEFEEMNEAERGQWFQPLLAVITCTA